VNQRGKRQIEKNVRKMHPRRRVQRRAPVAGSARPCGCIGWHVVRPFDRFTVDVCEACGHVKVTWRHGQNAPAHAEAGAQRRTIA
jgi:hypothetical protein